MSFRKIALFSVFTFLTAGVAFADPVDTTVVDTTVVDTTGGDSTTALSHGKSSPVFDLKRVGSGFTATLPSRAPVAFRLVDAHGRTVWSRTEVPVAGVVTLSRGSEVSLARGAYVLRAEALTGARRAPLFARRLVLDQ